MIRALVIVLLCVSILAMGSLVYAAFRLIGSNFSAGESENYEISSFDVVWPEGSEPVAVTVLPSGERIVVYKLEGAYSGYVIDRDALEVNDSGEEIDFQ